MALMLRLWQPCPVTLLAIEIVEENPTGGKKGEGRVVLLTSAFDHSLSMLTWAVSLYLGTQQSGREG